MLGIELIIKFPNDNIVETLVSECKHRLNLYTIEILLNGGVSHIIFKTLINILVTSFEIKSN